MSFTENDLRALDAKYAEAGVAFHARPLRAAMDVLRGGFVLGAGGNPEVQAVIDAYQKLFPDSDKLWPGMGVGLAASNDRVRRIVAPVAMGSPGPIDTYKCLGFQTHGEFETWVGGNLRQAARASYAVADLFDFSYGADDLRGGDATASGFWKLAESNLEDVTTSLASGYATASVIQPICICAELALKGALLTLGVTVNELKVRPFGHNLVNLAARLATERPHRDDALLARAAAAMPDYVGTRYADPAFTRLQLIDLALGSQFIAASALRRLSDRDMAGQMEAGTWPGPRLELYSF